MDYENPLDNLIHRFQHRWETDRQYRAAMSGVLGLVLILVLCTGVGVLDMAATRVLAAVGVQVPGASNGNASQPNTDTGVVVGNVRQFPTPTVPTWAVPGIPASSPIPSSGTPQPSPTPTPTPTDAATSTPCVSNCGGGGGGSSGHITANWSPTTWASGQAGAAFTVHASDKNGSPKAGVGIAIIYTWSGGATWLDESGATTDGAGNYTSHPTVGNCPASNHKMSAYVQAFFPDGKVENTWQIPCS